MSLSSLSSTLDSAPQIPSDYANHFIYGGVLGAVAFVLSYYWLSLHWSLLIGTGFVFLLCALKKIEDYFVKHETVSMCVGKTIITALLPALFLFASYLK